MATTLAGSTAEIGALADRILAASDALRSIPPLTGDRPGLTLADAYRVSAAVAERRVARGERPVGWKIGFTNRTIWDEYDVHAPIWGPVYDTTVSDGAGPLDLAPLVEPRIEPEIMLRFGRTPEPGMAAADLMDCIDAVGHGFEVVQSLYPDWRFRPEDTVAAFALHGRLRTGPWVEVRPDERPAWVEALETFSLRLARDGETQDEGRAANVLDGPLHACAHFVDGLADDPLARVVGPGDVVTTGTITRAFPVRPGETWTTTLSGIALPGCAITFA
ncbi:2-keto-4-pentenoate hydratase [Marinivivus vitaminiproducens]|uniref:2-keto-4-pentenoate hydratase n=1 Tax=Marinivivus vitaminiproducens TaxID=3035935 RepID=UPI0027A7C44A|nr:hypothetical protein P4R82_07925 [Geminicoccaceae bacterium SCSIO 64248]